MQRRAAPVDMIKPKECLAVLDEVFKCFKNKVMSNAIDQNFLRGVLQFSSRVQKHSESKFAFIWINTFAIT